MIAELHSNLIDIRHQRLPVLTTLQALALRQSLVLCWLKSNWTASVSLQMRRWASCIPLSQLCGLLLMRLAEPPAVCDTAFFRPSPIAVHVTSQLVLMNSLVTFSQDIKHYLIKKLTGRLVQVEGLFFFLDWALVSISPFILSVVLYCVHLCILFAYVWRN